MNDTYDRVWASDRRGSAKLFLLALAKHADPLGICWPNIETIGKLIGQTENYVRTLSRDAEALGDIVRRAGKGRGNTTIYGVACGLDADQRQRQAIIVHHTAVKKGVRYLLIDGRHVRYTPGLEDALFDAAIEQPPAGDDLPPAQDEKGVPEDHFSGNVKNPVRSVKAQAQAAPPPRRDTARQSRPGAGSARRPPPEPEHIRWLRVDEGITTAGDFAHLDPHALIEDYKNRRAEGQPKGAIVKYWKQYPPTPEDYYRGKNHAEDQQNRPANSRGPRPGDRDYYEAN